MKTCKSCGANLTQQPGCDTYTCDGCGTCWYIAPKPQGYWTAGGEDWWTEREMEDGYAPSNVYYVPFQEESGE